MYNKEQFGCEHRTIMTVESVELFLRVWRRASCLVLEMSKLPFETVLARRRQFTRDALNGKHTTQSTSLRGMGTSRSAPPCTSGHGP